MDFEKALAKFGAETLVKIDRVRRASILELFQLVVMATPVDTGRLRGNWQTTINAPATQEVDREDKGGSQVLAEALANLGGLPDVVYFTNNLPYAARIEFEGWSKQAPEGMLRLNVLKWPSIVEAKAKGYLEQ